MSSEQKQGLMAGKRGLIMGLANDKSIAWGIARAVAAQGGFPRTEAGLRTLPGIGPYTAAAIAAIAFDRRAVVVDAIDELLVLGADAPPLGRLLAAGEDGEQVIAALDERAWRSVGAGGH